jgi:hypothetical protein
VAFLRGRFPSVRALAASLAGFFSVALRLITTGPADIGQKMVVQFRHGRDRLAVKAGAPPPFGKPIESRYCSACRAGENFGDGGAAACFQKQAGYRSVRMVLSAQHDLVPSWFAGVGVCRCRLVQSKVATLVLDYGDNLWFNQMNRYDDLIQKN